MTIQNISFYPVSQSYQNLLQISSSGALYDALGSQVTYLQVTANTITTGYIQTTAGFTGSLFGTASQAISSSYALTASNAIVDVLSNENPYLINFTKGDGNTITFTPNAIVDAVVSNDPFPYGIVFTKADGSTTTSTPNTIVNVSLNPFNSSSIDFAKGDASTIEITPDLIANVTTDYVVSPKIITFTKGDQNQPPIDIPINAFYTASVGEGSIIFTKGTDEEITIPVVLPIQYDLVGSELYTTDLIPGTQKVYEISTDIKQLPDTYRFLTPVYGIYPNDVTYKLYRVYSSIYIDAQTDYSGDYRLRFLELDGYTDSYRPLVVSNSTTINTLDPDAEATTTYINPFEFERIAGTYDSNSNNRVDTDILTRNNRMFIDRDPNDSEFIAFGVEGSFYFNAGYSPNDQTYGRTLINVCIDIALHPEYALTASLSQVF